MAEEEQYELPLLPRDPEHGTHNDIHYDQLIDNGRKIPVKREILPHIQIAWQDAYNLSRLQGEMFESEQLLCLVSKGIELAVKTGLLCEAIDAARILQMIGSKTMPPNPFRNGLFLTHPSQRHSIKLAAISFMSDVHVRRGSIFSPIGFDARSANLLGWGLPYLAFIEIDGQIDAVQFRQSDTYPRYNAVAFFHLWVMQKRMPDGWTRPGLQLKVKTCISAPAPSITNDETSRRRGAKPSVF